MDEGEDVADRASLSGTATLNISLPVRRRGLLISAGLVAGALALPGAAGTWELADPVTGRQWHSRLCAGRLTIPTGAGIPANAESTPEGFDGPAKAWLDATGASRGRPGRIGSGTYDLRRRRPQGADPGRIFGYDTGGGRPVRAGRRPMARPSTSTPTAGNSHVPALARLGLPADPDQHLGIRPPPVSPAAGPQLSAISTTARVPLRSMPTSRAWAILDSVFERCDTGLRLPEATKYRIAGVHGGAQPGARGARASST